MAANATEMSCTAVTITTGMSGYFSFVRSNRPMPSRSAIIRSESINSNSSPEVRTARASIPEAACLQAYPAVPSMEATISRIGSSSSTTRMRSAIGTHESLSAIVTQRRDAESNHSGPETASRIDRAMIFKSKEEVRPQRDEHIPVVDLEHGGKAWGSHAHRGRIGSADSAGRLSARLACFPRYLFQGLGSGLGHVRGVAPGRTLLRAENTGAVRFSGRASDLRARRRIAGGRGSALHAGPRSDRSLNGDHAHPGGLYRSPNPVVAGIAAPARGRRGWLPDHSADCLDRPPSRASRTVGARGVVARVVFAVPPSFVVAVHRSRAGSGIPGRGNFACLE